VVVYGGLGVAIAPKEPVQRSIAPQQISIVNAFSVNDLRKIAGSCHLRFQIPSNQLLGKNLIPKKPA
jgi:hypothetical protein